MPAFTLTSLLASFYPPVVLLPFLPQKAYHYLGDTSSSFKSWFTSFVTTLSNDLLVSQLIPSASICCFLRIILGFPRIYHPLKCSPFSFSNSSSLPDHKLQDAPFLCLNHGCKASHAPLVAFKEIHKEQIIQYRRGTFVSTYAIEREVLVPGYLHSRQPTQV